MKNSDKWPLLLLEWFSKNRRPLPWRSEGKRDPYAVWVSEVMSQQTKVETVKPYYESWMEQFPSVAELAAADEQDVLRQWQGLGYYSRAKNLLTAVREVQNKYGGVIPSEKAELLTLKGVGDYTAGAISSLAYNRPVAAVDGNVLRVLARLYKIEENILSTNVKKEVTRLVESQIPPGRAGDFNEALMEFGAVICIPKYPRCSDCPLADFCEAKAAGMEKVLPVRLASKKQTEEKYAVLVCRRNKSVLVRQRPDRGLLASMWEFPAVRGEEGRAEEKLKDLMASVGISVFIEPEIVMTIKHVFSHKKWHLSVYEGQYTGGNLTEKEKWQWLPVCEYTSLPWAGPHGKITALLS